jgi:hypothetical protein
MLVILSEAVQAKSFLSVQIPLPQKRFDKGNVEGISDGKKVREK